MKPDDKNRSHALEKLKHGTYETSIIAPVWMDIATRRKNNKIIKIENKEKKEEKKEEKKPEPKPKQSPEENINKEFHNRTFANFDSNLTYNESILDNSINKKGSTNSFFIFLRYSSISNNLIFPLL